MTQVSRNWEWRIQYLRTSALAERGRAEQHAATAEYYEKLAHDLEVKLNKGQLDD
jgi:hypothetical protein